MPWPHECEWCGKTAYGSVKDLGLFFPKHVFVCHACYAGRVKLHDDPRQCECCGRTACGRVKAVGRLFAKHMFVCYLCDRSSIKLHDDEAGD